MIRWLINLFKISSDNTVTCTLIEDNWNSIYNNYINYMKLRKPIQTALGFKEWLKENYHPPIKK